MGYKLREERLSETIENCLLFRIIPSMKEAISYGRNNFEMGFELKNFIKKSVFGCNYDKIWTKVNNLEVLNIIDLVCTSNHYIVDVVLNKSIENPILNFTITKSGK